MPRISVIVPVYKVEQYLHKCIDSILNQTFTDFELILVDDGSPDNCPQICDEYAQIDSRVKVIHKNNEGQALARNTALDVAKGEYITFVDSDDFILDHMLERIYETAVAYDADIVTCNTYRKDIDDANLFYKEFSMQNRFESIQEYVVYKKHCGPPSKLYRRYIFDTIRFPDLRAYEDTYIWLDILNLTDRVVHIPDRLYFYNIHEGSVTTSRFSRKNLSILEASRHIQAFVSEYYPDLYNYVKYDYVNALYFVLCGIVSEFKLSELREEYKKAFYDLKEELLTFADDDTKIIQKYQWVIKHPMLFKIKATIIGVKKLCMR